MKIFGKAGSLAVSVCLMVTPMLMAGVVNAPLANAAEAQSVIPATTPKQTSTDGFFTLVTERVLDGGECVLNNGITSLPWDASNGGDGGATDGYLCSSETNASKDNSKLVYNLSWTVDATDGDKKIRVDFTNSSLYFNPTDINNICSSNPDGGWTASNRSGMACDLTFKGGYTYSGEWVLSVDPRTTLNGRFVINKVGLQTPLIKVDGETFNLPSYHLLSTPTPIVSGSFSTGGPRSSKTMIRDEKTYVVWTVDVKAGGMTATFDLSNLPQGSFVENHSTRANIFIPRASLKTAKADFLVPIDELNVIYPSYYSNLEPFAGLLPVDGLGQPETYRSAGWNGGSFTNNGAVMKLSYVASDLNEEPIVGGFDNPDKPYLREGDKTNYKVTLNPFAPGFSNAICFNRTDTVLTLDTTKDATLTVNGVITKLNIKETPGKWCSSPGNLTDSNNNVAVEIVNLPAITSEAVISIPFDVTKATNGNNLSMSTRSGGKSYASSQATYIIARVASNVEATFNKTSITAGEPGVLSVRFRTYLNSEREGDVLTSKATISGTVSSCVENLSLSRDVDGIESVVTPANVGPDGLACTSDDVSDWQVKITDNNDIGSNKLISYGFTTPIWMPKDKVVNSVFNLESLENLGGFIVDNEPTGNNTATFTSFHPTVVSQRVIPLMAEQDAGQDVKWNLVGNNGTATDGTATFTYELNSTAKRMDQMNLTTTEQADLSMVSVSNDGVTYTPASATQEPTRFIKIDVDSFNSGWLGNLQVSLDTSNAYDGDQLAIQALPATTDVTTDIIPAVNFQTVVINSAMVAPTVVTPANPTITDKPGYKDDAVVAPANTDQIHYSLSYDQTTGVWTLVSNAQPGYTFTSGAKTLTSTGVLSISGDVTPLKVTTPESAVVTDKAGWLDDTVTTPKTEGITYDLSYDRKTGKWTMTATANEGYVFSNGGTKLIASGKLDVAPIVVTPAKPTITDKPGYKDDAVVAPANNARITYKLVYPQKTGKWTLTATAAEGYVFAYGTTTNVQTGQLDVVVPGEPTPPAPPAPPAPQEPTAPPAPQEPTAPQIPDEIVTGEVAEVVTGLVDGDFNGFDAGVLGGVLAALAGGLGLGFLIRRRRNG